MFSPSSAVLFLFVTLCDFPLVQSGFPGRYHPLRYDRTVLMRQHERLKREVSSSIASSLQFVIEGVDSNYAIKLYPDKSHFSKNFVMHVNDKKVQDDYFPKFSVYSGYVVDDPNSTVYGDLSNGYFIGFIMTQGKHLFVEPAWKFFNKSTDFHSILYDSNQVDPLLSTCGTNEFPELNSNYFLKQSQHRPVRNLPGIATDKLVCTMRIIVEESYYTRFTQPLESLPASEIQKNRCVQAAGFVTWLMQSVNQVYKSTCFARGNRTFEVSLAVKELIVLTDSSSQYFIEDDLSHNALLKKHSSHDHSDYCLAYRLTARRFEGGVQGSAYIGTICDTNNAGITTVVSTNDEVLAMSQNIVVMAHEIGHNFGSSHDEDDKNDTCTVSKYIMSASTGNARDPENMKFSKCSIANMTQVILQKKDDPAANCFTEPSSCGNGIIDDGEECDYGSYCYYDNCCNRTSCMLAEGAQCSPQQGSCCSTLCTFQPSTYVCAESTICSLQRTCIQNTSACPSFIAINGNIGKSCDNAFVCDESGACNSSICTILKMKECKCPRGDLSCHICCTDQEEGCTPLQQLAGNSTINELLISNGIDVSLAKYTNGEPCNGYNFNKQPFEDGYCDTLSRCREFDPDLAIFSLLNRLLVESYAVLTWLQSMWWIIVLVSIFFLVLLNIIVIICHVSLRKTHSEDYKKRKELQSISRRHRHRSRVADSSSHIGRGNESLQILSTNHNCEDLVSVTEMDLAQISQH